MASHPPSLRAQHGNPASPHLLTLSSLAIFAWLAYRVISRAWVSDDAYITFRVVDNILNGFGAVWNIDERVQVYTHPLWMLLHIPFYALTGNIYLTTLALSFACFALAVTIAARGQFAGVSEAAFAFALPLSFSVPVIDFATSGLENPLAMLLVALFARQLIAESPRRLTLSLTSALIILTRMDLALLIAPAWLYLLLRHRPLAQWRPIALGALPLPLWAGFSLFYYGFVFPNTKYAKLNTGLTESDLWPQGLRYVMDLCINDLLSACFLAAACAACLYALIHRKPGWAPPAALAAGIVLYSLYVIAVGGDFMSGRFWAVPLFLAVWLLARAIGPHLMQPPRQAFLWAAALAVLFVISDLRHAKIWADGCPDAGPGVVPELSVCSFAGIVDERNYYVKQTGLFTGHSVLRRRPSGQWINEGHDWGASGEKPLIQGMIGIHGFYAGPHAMIADFYALSEPLLARLPLKQANNWRIGHFRRAIPEGFPAARATGDYAGMDPALAAYYAHLRTVISGDLWSAERLRTILAFQTGQYTPLLQDYTTRHCAEFYKGCGK